MSSSLFADPQFWLPHELLVYQGSAVDKGKAVHLGYMGRYEIPSFAKTEFTMLQGVCCLPEYLDSNMGGLGDCVTFSNACM